MIWKKVKRMPLSERGRLIAELGEGSELNKVLGGEYVVVGDESYLLVRRCSNCGDIDLLRHDVYAYGAICCNCQTFGRVEFPNAST